MKTAMNCWLTAVLLGFTVFFSSKTTAWIDADNVKFIEHPNYNYSKPFFYFTKHHLVVVKRANKPDEVHSLSSCVASYDLADVVRITEDEPED